jgi:heterotetrameric sarcosine oxidase delta subunit
MMQIKCPWCGHRGAVEFRYAGDVRTRPDPATATPLAWRDYLYVPANPRGPVEEAWYHRMGCQRFFTLRRDTATNESLSPEEEPR